VKAGVAKEIAREWVTREGTRLPGFAGAFLHGSINWLGDDDEIEPTSDLDVMIAIDGVMPAEKPGKFEYRGVLLEISYLPDDELRTTEQVLGRYNLAGSFHGASVIADPTGRLRELQRQIALAYPQRDWVERRCEDALANVLRNLDSLDRFQPLHAQVTSWLFGTGVTTHILLVAGLRNPTVRKRYLAARELLAQYDELPLYEELLRLLGCAEMTPERAMHHLGALEQAFDLAASLIQTPVFFAADITAAAKPVAIDGSREMIERGDHREAIFWMTATYARCQQVMHTDAPPHLRAASTAGFRELIDDLGAGSFAEMEARAEQVRAFLPAIMAAAGRIMDATPAIGGGSA
jgi:hypothetical protein